MRTEKFRNVTRKVQERDLLLPGQIRERFQRYPGASVACLPQHLEYNVDNNCTHKDNVEQIDAQTHSERFLPPVEDSGMCVCVFAVS